MECPQEMKSAGVCWIGSLAHPLRLGFIDETRWTVACGAGVAAGVTPDARFDQIVEIEAFFFRQHGFDFSDVLVAVDLLLLDGFPQQFVINDRIFVRADSAVLLEKVRALKGLLEITAGYPHLVARIFGLEDLSAVQLFVDFTSYRSLPGMESPGHRAAHA